MNSEQAIRALTALAQEHRLAIFRLLVKHGPAGLPAGDIGRHAGISPTSASFHLKELDHAGLIRASRDGRYIRYAFNVEAMQALLTFLSEDCCGGHPEICGHAFIAGDKICESMES